MSEPLTSLWPLVTASFGVAFFHAALPTHWLPFVLVGRAQGWKMGKTLSITALAGGGHVLFTVLLGALVVGAGVAVNRWMESVFPWIVGGVLVAFGLYYLRRHARGEAHGHHHSHHPHGSHAADHAHHHDHHHPHEHPPKISNAEAGGLRGDRAAVLGLLATLTFSPCEGFLPVFAAGSRHGWHGYLWLSTVLALATWLGMLAFTWLTLNGLERGKSELLERYQNAIVGALLLAIGIGSMLGLY
jgi:nickel/cobalt transporter (NicO) family protein